LSFDSGFDLAAYRNLRAALAELHIVRL
jgi:hypothetical protein